MYVVTKIALQRMRYMAVNGFYLWNIAVKRPGVCRAFLFNKAVALRYAYHFRE